MWTLVLLASSVFAFASSAAACYSPDDIQLELLVHQSVHDIGMDLPWSNHFHLKKTLSAFRDVIVEKFPSAQYSLVSYQDYALRGNCYHRYRPINVAGAYAESVSELWDDYIISRSLEKPFRDSSLTALALSATKSDDSGFTQEWFTPEGKRVVRILALVTDGKPYVSGEVHPWSPFVEDGTATCANDAPSLKQMADILEEKDMYVVVIATETAHWWWSLEGAKVLGDRMSLIKTDSVYKVPASHLTDLIMEQLCKVVSTTTTTTTKPTTTSKTTTTTPRTTRTMTPKTTRTTSTTHSSTTPTATESPTSSTTDTPSETTSRSSTIPASVTTRSATTSATTKVSTTETTATPASRTTSTTQRSHAVSTTSTHTRNPSCYSPDDIKLQMIIHQSLHDLGTSTAPNGNRTLLKRSLEGFLNELVSQYPEAEYDLVGFQDYANRDSCYARIGSLGSPEDYKKSVDVCFSWQMDSLNSRSLENPKRESSLSAVALSATRSQDSGFTRDWFTPEGRRVVRVLALITGAAPYQAGQVHPALPFTDDARATCENDAPSLEQVATILEDRDMYLVVLPSGSASAWWAHDASRVLGDRMTLRATDSVYDVPQGLLSDALKEQLCKVISTSTSTTDFPSL